MSNFVSFNATGVPRLNTYIPQATIAAGLIFVSGTAGVDPQTGKLISDSFEEQARQALNNIKTILEEAGSSINKVVKTTVWMVSDADPTFAAINKVYAEFFPENPPARSAPQVNAFPGDILVSIECIALA